MGGFQSWVSRRNKANDLFGCVVHSMKWQTMSQFINFGIHAEENNVKYSRMERESDNAVRT